MDDKEMTSVLQRIKSNLRVTKVVATRSVKGQRGDHFAGFAACFDSVQDEGAGIGKDLVETLDPTDGNVATGGMTLKEARVAHYLVSMQADIAAHEAALASGSISSQFCSDACKAIRSSYGKLIRRALEGNSGAPAEESAGK